jgi:hypothetical protein
MTCFSACSSRQGADLIRTIGCGETRYPTLGKEEGSRATFYRDAKSCNGTEKILPSWCCPSCAVAVRTHRRKLFHRVQPSLTWCMYTKLSLIVPQLAVDMRWNPQSWMWEEEQYRFVWSHVRMLDCETVGRQYPPTLHRRSFIFVLQTVRAIG